MSDTVTRRVEKLEERVNKAEADVAALSSELHLIKDDLSRRIGDLNDNLKNDAERMRLDLRERLNDLKADIKIDFDQVSTSLSELDDTVDSLNSSLQGLYITQKGSNVKININEKIIWAIIVGLSTGALYLIQGFMKGTGAL